MSKIRIAGAQISSVLGDVEANIHKHLEWIEQAKQERADVLVFPELSLTGYSIGTHGFSLARKRSAAEIQTIANASVGLTTIFGFMEEGPSAQFYNSAIAVRDGQVVHLHRKLNLPSYGQLEEGKYFASGRFVETQSLDEDWSFATLICADAWNPALVHLAAMHGATLMVFPISSSTTAVGGDFSNPEGWLRASGFYAMMYGCPVITVNRVGDELGSQFYGGSTIYDSNGALVASADDTEALLCAEVDYQNVRQNRYQLPTVRDSNLALISREMDRLVNILGVPEQFRDS